MCNVCSSCGNVVSRCHMKYCYGINYIQCSRCALEIIRRKTQERNNKR